MLRFIFSAVAGAALAYFVDPDHGKRRRIIARDRVLALRRRTSWRGTSFRVTASSTTRFCWG